MSLKVGFMPGPDSLSPPLPLPLCLRIRTHVACIHVALSYRSSAMHATMPAMMIMDSASETVNKTPIKCFPFEALPWSWCRFTAIEQRLRQCPSLWPSSILAQQTSTSVTTHSAKLMAVPEPYNSSKAPNSQHLSL